MFKGNFRGGGSEKLQGFPEAFQRGYMRSFRVIAERFQGAAEYQEFQEIQGFQSDSRRFERGLKINFR